MLLSLTTVLVVAIGLCVMAVEAAPYSGFAQTCWSCSYKPSFITVHSITCTCGDGKGGSKAAILDLGKCFANAGGLLVFRPNGNFAATCPNAELYGQGAYFKADCYTPTGDLVTNHINLDDFIGNFGGTLAC